ncbi:MAG: sulfotransferase family protein [Alphaproteobacteria bacterium]|nr:sulfotransferase family protein [Alphaproteobacteria bacterium]MBV9419586.1 sulfotransferase family protein [Alphaproteobacteria bacterium]
MPLKVVGAGFGRTGTRSLKEALEMLGFGPCHHMMEVFMNAETQVPFWDRVATGQKFDWEEGLGKYQSACDWPSCTFYKELADYYPQSKVILSLRDPKSWYKSVTSTILPAMKKPVDGAAGPRLPGVFGPKLMGEGTFHNDFSEANMIAVYERHNEEVKRTIPRDRLLVFEAKDGWEPLCKFLGVPVPDKPYPNMNTTEEFQSRVGGGRPPVH